MIPDGEEEAPRDRGGCARAVPCLMIAVVLVVFGSTAVVGVNAWSKRGLTVVKEDKFPILAVGVTQDGSQAVWVRQEPTLTALVTFMVDFNWEQTNFVPAMQDATRAVFSQDGAFCLLHGPQGLARANHRAWMPFDAVLLPGSKKSLLAMAITPDGSRAYSAQPDLAYWDIPPPTGNAATASSPAATYYALSSLKGEKIVALAASTQRLLVATPDLVATVDPDKDLVVKRRTFQDVTLIDVAVNEVDVVVSEGGRTVTFGNNFGETRMALPKPATLLAMSPLTGTEALVACEDGSIYLTRASGEVAFVRSIGETPSGLTWGRDGQSALVSTKSGRVLKVNLRRFK